MRLLLDSIAIDGMVVIGEGEKDKAPMLFNGERIGMYASAGGTDRFGREVTFDPSKLPNVDIAVDPIDGHAPAFSSGSPMPSRSSAMSERGTMFSPGHLVYMNKLAVGPEACGVIDMHRSVRDNLEAVARAKNKKINDLTCAVLDRPRNANFVTDIRACGARLKLITDGDVAAAVSTALVGTGVDMLFGIGGSPEAVISGRGIEMPRRRHAVHVVAPRRIGKGLCPADGLLVGRSLDDRRSRQGRTMCTFSATGITDGELLKGVQYATSGATTDSLVMRSRSGTVRRITANPSIEQAPRVFRDRVRGDRHSGQVDDLPRVISTPPLFCIPPIDERDAAAYNWSTCWVGRYAGRPAHSSCLTSGTIVGLRRLAALPAKSPDRCPIHADLCVLQSTSPVVAHYSLPWRRFHNSRID